MLFSCSEKSENIFTVDIEAHLYGGVDITMASIPAGSFLMGSNFIPPWEVVIDSTFRPHLVDTVYKVVYERPVHAVTIDAFKISTTEITQGQYETVMGLNPSGFSGISSFNFPVENVSWYDAVTFCNKLSEMTGLEPCYSLASWKCDFSKNGFRLPTEAEWEYACRAGSDLEWGKSAGSDDMESIGWFSGNSNRTTHPVGLKSPNPAGLYDMQGNVWEWCNDYFGMYNCNSQINPAGLENGVARVLRGGSWFTKAVDLRVASRQRDFPDYKSRTIGFRIVRR